MCIFVVGEGWGNTQISSDFKVVPEALPKAGMTVSVYLDQPLFKG